MPYQILRFTGDYPHRNARIAGAGADLSLHQHLNSVDDPTVNYALAKYLHASHGAANLAAEYVRTVCDRCLIQMDHAPRIVPLFDGPHSTPENRRGIPCLAGVNCPSIIMEPGFVSNPAFASWAKTPVGVDCLAGVIVHMVTLALPKGGVVALNVGHIGKTSDPDDRGAPVHGGGWEADICLDIVEAATTLLVAAAPGSVVIRE